LKISVNLSVEQLKSERFAEAVEQILKATGLAGDYLTLDITETMLINDTEGMIELLKHLHTFSIKVAIDDFGTGYSSSAPGTRPSATCIVCPSVPLNNTRLADA
jgi:EAL domain-containing protein (putative c-di-GMP-specific phosphodiesterase class I)